MLQPSIPGGFLHCCAEFEEINPLSECSSRFFPLAHFGLLLLPLFSQKSYATMFTAPVEPSWESKSMDIAIWRLIPWHPLLFWIETKHRMCLYIQVCPYYELWLLKLSEISIVYVWLLRLRRMVLKEVQNPMVLKGVQRPSRISQISQIKVIVFVQRLS